LHIPSEVIMLSIREPTNTQSPLPQANARDLWTGCEPVRDPRSVTSGEPCDVRVWQRREHHWGQPPAVHAPIVARLK
jgi:hypothetical protein